MSLIWCLLELSTILFKSACPFRLPGYACVCLQYKLFAHPANSHNSPDNEHYTPLHSTMSYNHIQRQANALIITLRQHRHWTRERQQRSDRQTGRPSIISAFVLSSTTLPAVLNSDQVRLVEAPQQIVDLEQGLQLSQSQGSLRSNTTSTSFPFTPALLEKQLPSKQWLHLTNHLRHSIFAVYQRLFTFVFLVNLVAVLVLLHHRSWQSSKALSLDNLATLASANFLLAILFRQDWLINLLFRSAWIVPWSQPLRVRRLVSRVYCYGGIHSGAAVMGTVWWILFTSVLSWEGVTGGNYTPLILILTILISSLLVTIIVLSLPKLRVRHHDTWELVHRFLGWLSIALFWAQILLLTHHSTTSTVPSNQYGKLLVQTPTFWILLFITFLLIYPWLFLRRWTFTATPLSNHALRLSFPNKVHKYSCVALSSAPLREWHPFATFPNVLEDGSGREASSMVVSAAGDWTRNLVQDAQWRSRQQALTGKGKESRKGVEMTFYVKSHPRAGVLSLSCLFKRVLIVTTGSGIGPSLSSLLDRPAGQYARLVWSTRSPLTTYGEDIMRLVNNADHNAVILDTDEMGRPDLLQVAWKMYREIEAEAVFVLSNEKVTKMLVGGLERRGVPAYGPIWDS